MDERHISDVCKDVAGLSDGRRTKAVEWLSGWTGMTAEQVGTYIVRCGQGCDWSRHPDPDDKVNPRPNISALATRMAEMHFFGLTPAFEAWIKGDVDLDRAIKRLENGRAVVSRETAVVTETTNDCQTMVCTVTPPPVRKKRNRRTKAQMEAARAAGER